MAKPELIRRFFYEDRGVNELTERSRENRLVNSRQFIEKSCLETLTEYGGDLDHPAGIRSQPGHVRNNRRLDRPWDSQGVQRFPLPDAARSIDIA